MSGEPAIRAVFLDEGGTLLAESPSRAEIYRDEALALGVEVGVERLRELMSAAHRRLPREIGPHFRYSEGWFRSFLGIVFADGLALPRSTLATLEGRLFARFADPRTFRLFPGALELVRELRRRGLRVGVISNWSERLPAVLDGIGIARELDFVLVSAIERCEKPESAIFERALALAGVDACSALHCGDDLDRDVRGAAALGILPVLVDRAGAHADQRCERVADLHELRRWILQRLPPT